MKDTIDLLEAIGQDAALRYASAEELTKVLVQAEASEALKEAVAFDDSLRLSKELGPIKQKSPQVNTGPCHEEEPEEEIEEEIEEEKPLKVPVPATPHSPGRK